MLSSKTKYPSAGSFIAALRHVPAAVCIVTTYVEERPWGLTVSAFSSVCAEPPTILVCVGRHTRTYASLEGSGVFGVSFLSEAQREQAESSAAPGAPKFIDAYCPDEDAGYSHEYGLGFGSIESEQARQFYWSDARVSSPVVHGAYCHLHCAATRIIDGGDHVIVLGRVGSVLDRSSEGARPLVYFNRGFHELGPRIAEREELRGPIPNLTKGL